jgi:hypothetical protein
MWLDRSRLGDRPPAIHYLIKLYLYNYTDIWFLAAYELVKL